MRVLAAKRTKDGEGLRERAIRWLEMPARAGSTQPEQPPTGDPQGMVERDDRPQKAPERQPPAKGRVGLGKAPMTRLPSLVEEPAPEPGPKTEDPKRRR